MKRDDIYYQAMLARDARFDGKFFVGVKTTGIYCRPICPARPKRENVEFFPTSHEAERKGYRPCLRCRPESAPHSPAWIGKSAIVQRAIKALHSPESFELDEDTFATKFGVTARHLRRLFVEEIGKTPKQLYFENRLNLARKLLSETTLSVTEVGYAAGFKSIRRFNDAFLARFKKSPREIRRSPLAPKALVLSASYRPPFDYAGLLRTYEAHRTGDLEWIENGAFHRVIEFDGKIGRIAVTDDSAHSRLLVEIDFPDSAYIPSIMAKVRAMFDLDSDPVVIANALEQDESIRKLLKRYPGLRLPSGWDPFEVAVSTILGQLVSVDRGRALVGDLIQALGKDSGLRLGKKSIRLFPTPQDIARSDLAFLKTTAVRRKTVAAFAQAITDGTLSLESTQDVEEFSRKALSIRGIGPWTVSYMALRVLRHTDAFPETDLLIARALKLHPKEVFESMRPWRGYAVALLWREYSSRLTSPRKLVKSQ